MIKKILVISLLIITLFAGVDASFENTYWGARPLAMGGAFTAVANDANAPLYNIAGIANVVRQEFTFMSSKLFTGVEGVDIGSNYLAFVYPVFSQEYGAISFAWASMSATSVWREDIFNIGYGRQLNDVFNLDTNIINLTAGLNLKYLMQEANFDIEDRDLPSSKGAPTCDVGVLAQFANGVSLGLSSKYLTSPDVGYVSENIVYNTNVIGLAYFSEEIPFVKIPFFTIAMDVLLRNNETNIKFGLESYVIEGRLALRAGARDEAFSFGFGYEHEFQNGTKMIFDYALEIPTQVQETLGSHFVGLSFRFA
ncbi:MAG: hypothetical protein PHR82_07235 [Endomicrobiaceae bacterium]|nr:hypothetical protein [Endomicrobiaceae bacterium]